MGASIREFAEKVGLERPFETAKLFGRWQKIVGVDIAARCEPVSLKQGVLSLRTTSAAWASELKYLAPELIKRVNQELGGEVVTAVKASVKPPTTPKHEPRHTSLDSSSTHPVGPLVEVDKITKTIGDERLAKATQKALLAARMRSEKGPSHGTIKGHSEASTRPPEDPKRHT